MIKTVTAYRNEDGEIVNNVKYTLNETELFEVLTQGYVYAMNKHNIINENPFELWADLDKLLVDHLAEMCEVVAEQQETNL